MSDFQQDIVRLLSSPHYQKLTTYKSPFDPFEVMGIPYRELSHSHVLAWLLRDEANKEFRQEFISWMVSKLKDNNLSVGTGERVEVRLEFGDDKAGRIDVFAHFTDLKLAVAIEVKVWAGEEESQIARYQDFLKREYTDYRKVVIFLTPLGEHPETSVEEPEVPVLNMSWDEVARIIEQMQTKPGENNDFRTQFRWHLRRFVMNERKEQRIVKDLLREGNNAKTIQRLIDNMPSLWDFSEQWKKIVSDVCGVEKVNLELKAYIPQHVVGELKIKVPEWSDAGLPFTLMLYKYDTAGVRVLIRNTDYDTHKEKLFDFAKFSDGIIDCNFPKLADWIVWRAVLSDDKSMAEPSHTLIDAEIYNDEAWEDEVKVKLKSQMSNLLKPIKEWLACDS